MVRPDLTLKEVIIHCVKPTEYTKILGVPFWIEGEEAPFWESLYHKIKTKLASWHSKLMLTIKGRAMLANALRKRHQVRRKLSRHRPKLNRLDNNR
jgi:hypothetical protein